eukprot:Amastigsp_a188524_23.p4 type:complete len:125 gc:universal Amastigsp_a188524_23:471-97(-)
MRTRRRRDRDAQLPVERPQLADVDVFLRLGSERSLGLLAPDPRDRLDRRLVEPCVHEQRAPKVLRREPRPDDARHQIQHSIDRILALVHAEGDTLHFEVAGILLRLEDADVELQVPQRLGRHLF